MSIGKNKHRALYDLRSRMVTLQFSGKTISITDNMLKCINPAFHTNVLKTRNNSSLQWSFSSTHIYCFVKDASVTTKQFSGTW